MRRTIGSDGIGTHDSRPSARLLSRTVAGVPRIVDLVVAAAASSSSSAAEASSTSTSAAAAGTVASAGKRVKKISILKVSALRRQNQTYPLDVSFLLKSKLSDIIVKATLPT